MFNLRGGFLVRPLIYALVLGAIGAILSILEANYPWISRITPRFLFPSNDDPALCQVILSSIAGSMMTVGSIVFAILLMTLTLASMQYSPRILVAFAQDRVMQQTLGIFIGTFAYCIAALPAARSMPHPFGPVTTVSGAMLLALACVVCLLFFIHHISQAISVNHIVDRIALETISPGVNDLSTAINCIDHLGRILIRYGSRAPQECLLYDPPGVLRVIVRGRGSIAWPSPRSGRFASSPSATSP